MIGGLLGIEKKGSMWWRCRDVEEGKELSREHESFFFLDKWAHEK